MADSHKKLRGLGMHKAQRSRRRPVQEDTSSLFSDPSLYINRELSWLEFSQRVLEEVQASRNQQANRKLFNSLGTVLSEGSGEGHRS